MSSTGGHRPSPGAAHYGASKATLEALTRSWAVELAADGMILTVDGGLELV
ncbi:SDR family oxidoreductase [Streptomyces sp. NBC_01615]|uniref:SDR family oxidoreductase n=1 Tax=Streptomyces sp. NBC_01615 TaxID=2975898 RepID=UPI0038678477